MTARNITLIEYQTHYLPENELDIEDGASLWRSFDQKGKKIQIAFPSPKTGQQWQLTAQGWVGHLPLTPQLTLQIQPKVNLANIFRMWEVAYRLRSYHFLDSLTGVASLEAFYERVVVMLLQRVQKRERQGFHRTYRSVTRPLPAVRGHIQIQPHIPTPAQLICRYDEQTADIPDNQILACTLSLVARGRRCSTAVQTAVRHTVHRLYAITTPQLFQAADCVARPYTRLNQDYQAMHALCRFLLEHHTPQLAAGRQPMHPFLINMARLFELFVAQWLQANLPPPWSVKVQERVTIGRHDELKFDIDLVLYAGDGRVHAVLDTKYKTAHKAANSDINQMIAYAQAKGSPQAILIYPAPLTRPLNVQLHNLHLRSLTFALDEDLDTAGQQLLADLLPGEN